jgi:hypothetical protein
MSKFFTRGFKPRSQRTFASPQYLLEWAAMLTILFIVVQLAGLREFTSVLNGTIGSTSLSWQTASFLGAAYIFVYLGFVLGVPILILAAGILKIWQRIAATKQLSDESRTNASKS